MSSFTCYVLRSCRPWWFGSCHVIANQAISFSKLQKRRFAERSFQCRHSCINSSATADICCREGGKVEAAVVKVYWPPMQCCKTCPVAVHRQYIQITKRWVLPKNFACVRPCSSLRRSITKRWSKLVAAWYCWMKQLFALRCADRCFLFHTWCKTSRPRKCGLLCRF